MRKRFKILLIVIIVIICMVGFGLIAGSPFLFLMIFLSMFDSGTGYCESDLLFFKYSGSEFDAEKLLDDLKTELEHNYDSSYAELIDSSRIIKPPTRGTEVYVMKFVNDLQTNSTETIAIMTALENIDDISEVTGPYGRCVAP